ncbi:MAG: type II toxin-antitoxin system HicB family antitoxin [Chloroflexi bacterium]|nr:type II toxin-antitoxin system HicB family antitoxin [Chloroflexota bacterium]
MGRHKVTVILIPDEDGYVAYIPSFPSCNTSGDSPRQALENAKESLELLFVEPSEDDLEDLNFAHADHVTVGEVELELPVKPKPTKTLAG